MKKMGTIVLMKSFALLTKTSLAIDIFEFAADVRVKVEIDRADLDRCESI
jgi:hypothetical protein